MNNVEYLKTLNDTFKDFQFFEEDHHYEFKGKQVGISVTKLIEEYCNEFDSQAVAQKVADKEKKNIQDVLNEWKAKNDWACYKGHIGHVFAQTLWYGIFTLDDVKSLTVKQTKALETISQQAKNFYNDYKGRLEHLVDEFVIGSEEYDIASAIDHLFINRLTNELVLVDYKTNSNIHKSEKYAKDMKIPLNHLKDFTLNHYYIQLSIYKYLVEKYSGLKVSEMFIVWFSENIENYEIIEVPYLQKEVKKILENRKIKNMNSLGILIMGGSGTGKSTSLRNLPANETAIINVTNKPMPFKNKNGINIVSCSNYEQMINAIIKTPKRIIVIDDSSYMMTFENFEKATNKGYDKFTTMAVNYYDLITTPQKCDGEKIIYFITHEEVNEDLIAKPKTIGKMLSQQLVIEGLFTVVLRSMLKNNEYVFQTHNDGTSVCKSPIDMFKDDFIPNDLSEVDKVIREYYGFKPIEIEK